MGNAATQVAIALDETYTILRTSHRKRGWYASATTKEFQSADGAVTASRRILMKHESLTKLRRGQVDTTSRWKIIWQSVTAICPKLISGAINRMIIVLRTRSSSSVTSCSEDGYVLITHVRVMSL